MATRKNKVITFPQKLVSYDAESEKAENIIGQRISEARKRTGMTQQEFIEHLVDFGVTVSKAAESKWETGETVPNAYQLISVCAALGMDECVKRFAKKFTPVLNDEGERKVAEYRADLVASGKYRPTINKIRYIEMPVSSLVASAGTGAFLDEGNFDMVSFPAASVPDDAEFGIRVSGDSMEPVYHDGQIVWVERCDTIGIGEVGIFILDGEGYIKSYDEQEPAESEREEYTDSYGIMHMQPILVSYNQKYLPRFVAPASDFHLVGRVL